MNRPWLTFDPDGSPRIHVPTGDHGNTMSVVLTPEVLAEFLLEAKAQIAGRAKDPKLTQSVGGAILGMLDKLINKPNPNGEHE